MREELIKKITELLYKVDFEFLDFIYRTLRKRVDKTT